MQNELVVEVNKSPNLLALVKKIKLPLYMIEWIKIGCKEIELISEEDLEKEPLSLGNTVHFFSKKDTHFSEEPVFDI